MWNVRGEPLLCLLQQTDEQVEAGGHPPVGQQVQKGAGGQRRHAEPHRGANHGPAAAPRAPHAQAGAPPPRPEGPRARRRARPVDGAREQAGASAAAANAGEDEASEAGHLQPGEQQEQPPQRQPLQVGSARAAEGARPHPKPAPRQKEGARLRAAYDIAHPTGERPAVPGHQHRAPQQRRLRERASRGSGSGPRVRGAHREDDRRLPGRGAALPHGIAGLAVHHLQGRLLHQVPALLAIQRTRTLDGRHRPQHQRSLPVRLAGVSARQAPDPTNPPQPAAAPSKPQPRRGHASAQVARTQAR